MMKINNKHRTPSSSAGFTLLEVLITLVIFSVGILGLASIQIQAMQFVHGAYVKSQVQVLSYDMLDRLRANRIEAMTTNNYLLSIANNPSAPGTNCATASCTSSQMTTFDIYEWRQILDQQLPQGKGAISFVNVGTGRIYTIDIQWLDNRTIEVIDVASFNKRYETFTFKVEL